jgi:hypothetical protein
MDKRWVMPLFALLGATVFVIPVQAQRRGAFASAPASRASFVRMRRAHRFSGGSGFVPFYSDYNSEPGVSELPSPQIIVMQSAHPAPPAPLAKPPESLVLELQANHWVRITNYGQSEAGRQASDLQPDATRRTPEPESATQLPRAVLVFRDGHKEEIGKYTIMGTTVYTSADYWSSGSWTRKVQIAELDVPATLKLNQERGAKFSLPSGPNEVMIRP